MKSNKTTTGPFWKENFRLFKEACKNNLINLRDEKNFLLPSSFARLYNCIKTKNYDGIAECIYDGLDINQQNVFGMSIGMVLIDEINRGVVGSLECFEFLIKNFDVNLESLYRYHDEYKDLYLNDPAIHKDNKNKIEEVHRKIERLLISHGCRVVNEQPSSVVIRTIEYAIKTGNSNLLEKTLSNAYNIAVENGVTGSLYPNVILTIQHYFISFGCEVNNILGYKTVGDEGKYDKQQIYGEINKIVGQEDLNAFKELIKSEKFKKLIENLGNFTKRISFINNILDILVRMNAVEELNEFITFTNNNIIEKHKTYFYTDCLLPSIIKHGNVNLLNTFLSDTKHENIKKIVKDTLSSYLVQAIFYDQPIVFSKILDFYYPNQKDKKRVEMNEIINNNFFKNHKIWDAEKNEYTDHRVCSIIKNKLDNNSDQYQNRLLHSIHYEYRDFFIEINFEGEKIKNVKKQIEIYHNVKCKEYVTNIPASKDKTDGKDNRAVSLYKSLLRCGKDKESQNKLDKAKDIQERAEGSALLGSEFFFNDYAELHGYAVFEEKQRELIEEFYQFKQYYKDNQSKIKLSTCPPYDEFCKLVKESGFTFEEKENSKTKRYEIKKIEKKSQKVIVINQLITNIQKQKKELETLISNQYKIPSEFVSNKNDVIINNNEYDSFKMGIESGHANNYKLYEDQPNKFFQFVKHFLLQQKTNLPKYCEIFRKKYGIPAEFLYACIKEKDITNVTIDTFTTSYLNEPLDQTLIAKFYAAEFDERMYSLLTEQGWLSLIQSLVLDGNFEKFSQALPHLPSAYWQKCLFEAVKCAYRSGNEKLAVYLKDNLLDKQTKIEGGFDWVYLAESKDLTNNSLAQQVDDKNFTQQLEQAFYHAALGNKLNNIEFLNTINQKGINNKNETWKIKLNQETILFSCLKGAIEGNHLPLIYQFTSELQKLYPHNKGITSAFTKYFKESLHTALSTNNFILFNTVYRELAKIYEKNTDAVGDAADIFVKCLHELLSNQPKVSMQQFVDNISDQNLYRKVAGKFTKQNLNRDRNPDNEDNRRLINWKKEELIILRSECLKIDPSLKFIDFTQDFEDFSHSKEDKYFHYMLDKKLDSAIQEARGFINSHKEFLQYIGNHKNLQNIKKFDRVALFEQRFPRFAEIKKLIETKNYDKLMEMTIHYEINLHEKFNFNWVKYFAYHNNTDCVEFLINRFGFSVHDAAFGAAMRYRNEDELKKEDTLIALLCTEKSHIKNEYEIETKEDNLLYGADEAYVLCGAAASGNMEYFKQKVSSITKNPDFSEKQRENLIQEIIQNALLTGDKKFIKELMIFLHDNPFSLNLRISKSKMLLEIARTEPIIDIELFSVEEYEKQFPNGLYLLYQCHGAASIGNIAVVKEKLEAFFNKIIFKKSKNEVPSDDDITLFNDQLYKIYRAIIKSGKVTIAEFEGVIETIVRRLGIKDISQVYNGAPSFEQIEDALYQGLTMGGHKSQANYEPSQYIRTPFGAEQPLIILCKEGLPEEKNPRGYRYKINAKSINNAPGLVKDVTNKWKHSLSWSSFALDRIVFDRTADGRLTTEIKSAATQINRDNHTKEWEDIDSRFKKLPKYQQNIGLFSVHKDKLEEDLHVGLYDPIVSYKIKESIIHLENLNKKLLTLYNYYIQIQEIQKKFPSSSYDIVKNILDLINHYKLKIGDYEENEENKIFEYKPAKIDLTEMRLLADGIVEIGKQIENYNSASKIQEKDLINSQVNFNDVQIVEFTPNSLFQATLAGRVCSPSGLKSNWRAYIHANKPEHFKYLQAAIQQCFVNINEVAHELQLFIDSHKEHVDEPKSTADNRTLAIKLLIELKERGAIVNALVVEAEDAFNKKDLDKLNSILSSASAENHSLILNRLTYLRAMHGLDSPAFIEKRGVNVEHEIKGKAMSWDKDVLPEEYKILFVDNANKQYIQNFKTFVFELFKHGKVIELKDIVTSRTLLNEDKLICEYELYEPAILGAAAGGNIVALHDLLKKAEKYIPYKNKNEEKKEIEKKEYMRNLALKAVESATINLQPQVINSLFREVSKTETNYRITDDDIAKKIGEIPFENMEQAIYFLSGLSKPLPGLSKPLRAVVASKVQFKVQKNTVKKKTNSNELIQNAANRNKLRYKDIAGIDTTTCTNAALLKRINEYSSNKNEGYFDIEEYQLICDAYEREKMCVEFNKRIEIYEKHPRKHRDKYTDVKYKIREIANKYQLIEKTSISGSVSYETNIAVLLGITAGDLEQLDKLIVELKNKLKEDLDEIQWVSSAVPTRVEVSIESDFQVVMKRLLDSDKISSINQIGLDPSGRILRTYNLSFLENLDTYGVDPNLIVKYADLNEANIDTIERIKNLVHTQKIDVREAIYAAARCNNRALYNEWMSNQSVRLEDRQKWALQGAVAGANIDLIKEILSTRLDDQFILIAIEEAAYFGYEDLINNLKQLIKNNNKDENTNKNKNENTKNDKLILNEVIKGKCRRGDLSVIDKINTENLTEAISLAATENRVELIDVIFEIHDPTDDLLETIIEDAALNGHLALIIQTLNLDLKRFKNNPHKFGYNSPFPPEKRHVLISKILKLAAFAGHVHIVNFIYYTYPKIDKAEIQKMREAITNGTASSTEFIHGIYDQELREKISKDKESKLPLSQKLNEKISALELLHTDYANIAAERNLSDDDNSKKTSITSEYEAHINNMKNGYYDPYIYYQFSQELTKTKNLLAKQPTIKQRKEEEIDLYLGNRNKVVKDINSILDKVSKDNFSDLSSVVEEYMSIQQENAESVKNILNTQFKYDEEQKRYQFIASQRQDNLIEQIVTLKKLNKAIAFFNDKITNLDSIIISIKKSLALDIRTSDKQSLNALLLDKCSAKNEVKGIIECIDSTSCPPILKESKLINYLIRINKDVAVAKEALSLIDKELISLRRDQMIESIEQFNEINLKPELFKDRFTQQCKLDKLDDSAANNLYKLVIYLGDGSVRLSDATVTASLEDLHQLYKVVTYIAKENELVQFNDLIQIINDNLAQGKWENEQVVIKLIEQNFSENPAVLSIANNHISVDDVTKKIQINISFAELKKLKSAKHLTDLSSLGIAIKLSTFKTVSCDPKIESINTLLKPIQGIDIPQRIFSAYQRFRHPKESTNESLFNTEKTSKYEYLRKLCDTVKFNVETKIYEINQNLILLWLADEGISNDVKLELLDNLKEIIIDVSAEILKEKKIALQRKAKEVKECGEFFGVDVSSIKAIVEVDVGQVNLDLTYKVEEIRKKITNSMNDHSILKSRVNRLNVPGEQQYELNSELLIKLEEERKEFLKYLQQTNEEKYSDDFKGYIFYLNPYKDMYEVTINEFIGQLQENIYPHSDRKDLQLLLDINLPEERFTELLKIQKEIRKTSEKIDKVTSEIPAIDGGERSNIQRFRKIIVKKVIELHAKSESPLTEDDIKELTSFVNLFVLVDNQYVLKAETYTLQNQQAAKLIYQFAGEIKQIVSEIRYDQHLQRSDNDAKTIQSALTKTTLTKNELEESVSVYNQHLKTPINKEDLKSMFGFIEQSGIEVTKCELQQDKLLKWSYENNTQDTVKVFLDAITYAVTKPYFDESLKDIAGNLERLRHVTNYRELFAKQLTEALINKFKIDVSKNSAEVEKLTKFINKLTNFTFKEGTSLEEGEIGISYSDDLINAFIKDPKVCFLYIQAIADDKVITPAINQCLHTDMQETLSKTISPNVGMIESISAEKFIVDVAIECETTVEKIKHFLVVNEKGEVRINEEVHIAPKTLNALQKGVHEVSQKHNQNVKEAEVQSCAKLFGINPKRDVESEVKQTETSNDDGKSEINEDVTPSKVEKKVASSEIKKEILKRTATNNGLQDRIKKFNRATGANISVPKATVEILNTKSNALIQAIENSNNNVTIPQAKEEYEKAYIKVQEEITEQASKTLGISPNKISDAFNLDNAENNFADIQIYVKANDQYNIGMFNFNTKVLELGNTDSNQTPFAKEVLVTELQAALQEIAPGLDAGVCNKFISCIEIKGQEISLKDVPKGDPSIEDLEKANAVLSKIPAAITLVKEKRAQKKQKELEKKQEEFKGKVSPYIIDINNSINESGFSPNEIISALRANARLSKQSKELLEFIEFVNTNNKIHSTNPLVILIDDINQYQTSLSKIELLKELNETAKYLRKQKIVTEQLNVLNITLQGIKKSKWSDIQQNLIKLSSKNEQTIRNDVKALLDKMKWIEGSGLCMEDSLKNKKEFYDSLTTEECNDLMHVLVIANLRRLKLDFKKSLTKLTESNLGSLQSGLTTVLANEIESNPYLRDMIKKVVEAIESKDGLLTYDLPSEVDTLLEAEMMTLILTNAQQILTGQCAKSSPTLFGVTSTNKFINEKNLFLSDLTNERKLFESDTILVNEISGIYNAASRSQSFETLAKAKQDFNNLKNRINEAMKKEISQFVSYINKIDTVDFTYGDVGPEYIRSTLYEATDKTDTRFSQSYYLLDNNVTLELSSFLSLVKLDPELKSKLGKGSNDIADEEATRYVLGRCNPGKKNHEDECREFYFGMIERQAKERSEKVDEIHQNKPKGIWNAIANIFKKLFRIKDNRKKEIITCEQNDFREKSKETCKTFTTNKTKSQQAQKTKLANTTNRANEVFNSQSKQAQQDALRKKAEQEALEKAKLAAEQKLKEEQAKLAAEQKLKEEQAKLAAEQKLKEEQAKLAENNEPTTTPAKPELPTKFKEIKAYQERHDRVASERERWEERGNPDYAVTGKRPPTEQGSPQEQGSNQSNPSRSSNNTNS